MQTYLVGGAVRDELVGYPHQEKDWVVVGATPDEMLAAGYRQVGKDFPVFLHPETGEEYALARTERKTSPGYKGFDVHATPDVSLEEDLLRRDLTINALAKDESANIIDPFNGLGDLNVTHDLFTFDLTAHRLLTRALLLALHRGQGFLTPAFATGESLIQGQLARAASAVPVAAPCPPAGSTRATPVPCRRATIACG